MNKIVGEEPIAEEADYFNTPDVVDCFTAGNPISLDSERVVVSYSQSEHQHTLSPNTSYTCWLRVSAPEIHSAVTLEWRNQTCTSDNHVSVEEQISNVQVVGNPLTAYIVGCEKYIVYSNTWRSVKWSGCEYDYDPMFPYTSKSHPIGIVPGFIFGICFRKRQNSSVLIGIHIQNTAIPYYVSFAVRVWRPEAQRPAQWEKQFVTPALGKMNGVY